MIYRIDYSFNFFEIASAHFVGKFTYINIVDFFITRSITSNKFALSSLNQELRLLAIFNGDSIENYYSTRLFIAKGNSPPRAEGQRWEAQRVAKQ